MRGAPDGLDYAFSLVPALRGYTHYTDNQRDAMQFLSIRRFTELTKKYNGPVRVWWTIYVTCLPIHRTNASTRATKQHDDASLSIGTSEVPNSLRTVFPVIRADRRCVATITKWTTSVVSAIATP